MERISNRKETIANKIISSCDSGPNQLSGSEPLKKPIFAILNWKEPNDPEAGGAEKYCASIAEGALLDGYDVIWFSRNYKNFNGSDEPVSGNIKFIKVGGKFSYYLLYIFKILYMDIDILFISVNSIPFFDFLIRSKIKIVHVHHLVPYPVLKQKLSLFAPIAYFMQNFLLRVLYRSSIVTTNGVGVKKELEILGVKNVTKLPTAITSFCYDSFPSSTISNIIVAPGAFRPWKRPNDIILAFKYSQVDGELIMFGRPENSLIIDSLNMLIGSLGIADKVKLYCNIDEAKKTDIYKKAKIAVVAPIKEGFGLSSLEPQAFGCPVVGYNVPGINESVIHNETGILVEDGDIFALASAIRTLYLDSEMRAKMSVSCLENSNKYTLEKAYLDLKKLINTKLDISGIKW